MLISLGGTHAIRVQAGDVNILLPPYLTKSTMYTLAMFSHPPGPFFFCLYVCLFTKVHISRLT